MNNRKDPKPIKVVTLADQVEDRLMEYLKENQFSAGDPLPKETEFAALLGVSRNVVREGLSRLRMLGLVESKKRKGMVLAEPDLLSGISRMMYPEILGEETMKDLFELRLVLEVGMSDLLFARKTADDIEVLSEIATRESNETNKSLKVALDYEIEFHSKLYDISGNDILRRFQKMLLPIFNYMMEVEATLDKAPQKGKVDHFDLIETLKTGTPALFRKNMREHLTPHYERL